MVLLSGSWSFNRFSVVLEVLDINVHPTRVPLVRLPFWVHVFGLPYNCWSEDVAKALGGAFAGYITWDRRTNLRLGAYFRMKVWVDITVPLRRGQALAAENGDKIEVFFQYERLHNHCFICGLLDHVARDCDQEQLPPGADAPYSGLRAESQKAELDQQPRRRYHSQPQRERGPRPEYSKNTSARYASGEGFSGNDDNLDDHEFDLELEDEVVSDNNSQKQKHSRIPRKDKEGQSDLGLKIHTRDDGGQEASDSSFNFKGTQGPRKRAGGSSSAPDQSGTGATPPLKKHMSKNGLGSADAAGQLRSPQ